MHKIKKLKAQNAIEFLITYSWAFLLITVMISVLVIYSSAPKEIISSSCVAYSGFNCIDSLLKETYTANVATGSKLIILLNDKQVGITNITSFNAILDTVKSTSGSCKSISGSNTFVSGDITNCSAGFNSIFGIGVMETGIFTIKGTFCAPQISQINNNSAICTNPANYITNGFIRVQVQS